MGQQTLLSLIATSRHLPVGRILARTLAAAFSLALVLLTGGCAKRETAADAGIRTQTLLIGNAAEPADLDPDILYAWTDANVAYALFEGLTWIDEKTTQPIPAAAASWDVSPDGLIYTFHLRPEGRWSNGDPVTAADFAYSFRRILTPTLKFRATRDARNVCGDALEMRGGIGYVEEFATARLLRDARHGTFANAANSRGRRTERR